MTHQAVVPPSTAMSAPVTNELSSEARNSAAGATSSGWPTRPNISFSIMGPRNSGSLRSSRVAPVSMRPGEIVLARMLCLPPSIASCRVMARTPPLAAVCAMPGQRLVGDLCRGRRNIDDRAAAARHKVRPDCLAKAKDDQQLTVDGAGEFLKRELIHPAEIGRRRIFVHDVDAAVALQREFDKRIALVLLRQIGGLQRHHLPASLPRLAQRGLRVLGVD